MSLMSATLCSRPTSFLRNQHNCVLLTNLKTARIVKGSEHIKPKSSVLWMGHIRFQKLPELLQMLCSTC